MVPYTLPFSAVFLSKIIVSSVAVVVITTVTMNSAGSVTVGASNGTVVMVPMTTCPPDTGPPDGPGGGGEKKQFGQNQTGQGFSYSFGGIVTQDNESYQVFQYDNETDQLKLLGLLQPKNKESKPGIDNLKKTLKRKKIWKREAAANEVPFVSDRTDQVAPKVQTPESFLSTSQKLESTQRPDPSSRIPDLTTTTEPIKTHAIDQFPADFVPENIRNSGGVIIHILILAYCCLSLGVVCDIYFLPALQFISNALSLPPDIAGATFMAIGTSAPELFTSVIGVFISQDDIGTGTILGTAVFNLIAIPSACGFAAVAFCQRLPKISSFPILRDCLFYIVTIMVMILCIMDNQINWIESLIMISMFGVYLVIMYYNAQFSHLLESSGTTSPEEAPLLDNRKTSDLSNINYSDLKGIEVTKVEEEEDEDDWINGNIFIKCLLMPMTLLFKLTLPKPTKLLFVVTFCMSVVWIGMLTYVCVWMVTIIGFTFGIPDTIAGLTILAIGTSFPELISSIIVVKKGLADMAICNSIGSNIFDILFCLSVPWLLKSITLMFKHGTIDLAKTAIPIQSEALPFTALTLLLTVFALVATFRMTNWRLGLTVGVTCTVVYVIFCVLASVFEIQMN